MARNAILDELHEIRRQILSECDGDISAYIRDAQARLEASGRPIAKLKQRRIRRSGAETPRTSAVENQSPSPAER